MPLLRYGRLQVSKSSTSSLCHCEFITLLPGHVLMNYDFKYLKNQHLYTNKDVLLKMIEYLFEYRDDQINKMQEYETKIADLEAKVQVSLYISIPNWFK